MAVDPRPTCKHCGRRFPAPPARRKGPPPTDCGRPTCRALATYTEADWQARARMANARRAAGIAPAFPELDAQALRRTPSAKVGA